MRDRKLPATPGGDAGRSPPLDRGVAEPVGVVAPVCKQRPGLRDGGQERPSADVVRGLSRRQEHLDRAALRVCHDVQFRVEPAPGPPPSRAIAAQYPAGQWISRPRPPFEAPGSRPSDGPSRGSRPLPGRASLRDVPKGDHHDPGILGPVSRSRCHDSRVLGPVSCACPANSIRIVASTPIRLHRFHRLLSVLGGP